MKTADFDYYLPEKLIAQTPLTDRAASRLLLVDRGSKNLEHDVFKNITDYLSMGDVLVLNDTKVLPARLLGIKKETNAVIEVLLLTELENDTWESLTKPAKRVKIGSEIVFGDGLLIAKCIGVGEEGIRQYKMIYQGIFLEILDQLGEMPLPPYIHERLNDPNRYQTVYSKAVGSAAAPTAGLHFTQDLLEQVKAKGVEICTLTLHVGLGTFRPVQVDDVLNHKMHSEFYLLNQETADRLNCAKKENRRIVAVGTTTTRTLETVFKKYNRFTYDTGWTDIFIYPGFSFQAIDALITNFHLPKSTLIMLVSAFSSKEIIMNAYEKAVQEQYRFFSFGDSMFIYDFNKKKGCAL